MTKRTKTYQDPKKLLRSIIIDAGVIAAEYRVATTRSAHKKIQNRHNTKKNNFEFLRQPHEYGQLERDAI